MTPTQARQLRQISGRSQSDIARCLGVSQAMVGFMETGARRIPPRAPDVLLRAARDAGAKVQSRNGGRTLEIRMLLR